MLACRGWWAHAHDAESSFAHANLGTPDRRAFRARSLRSIPFRSGLNIAEAVDRFRLMPVP
jgi:hypothetical protein